MWNMVTLDGFFEGPKSWELDWHNEVWGDELERFSVEQLRAADMLLLGRVTYQGMASYWPSAKGETAELMNGIAKVVFSRTLDKAEWNNTQLVKADAAKVVAQLKQQPGKGMLIFGSANLSAQLMQNGLIDEYRLGLNPLVLGGGNPLFKPSARRMRMKLLEARPLRSGCVLLRYRPESGALEGPEQTAPKNIDEYIAGFPDDVQGILQKIRTTIREAAPDATERISYQIPTFYLKGNLVHFAAFKRHIGFYPTSTGIEKFKDELAVYKGAKGSVQFPLDKPIPLHLISEIVKFRVGENLDRAEAKRKKR
jgi:uncharacterized protein YdhG (YjbR/CyaY superfamily)/dihydrofolate reductase